MKQLPEFPRPLDQRSDPDTPEFKSEDEHRVCLLFITFKFYGSPEVNPFKVV